MIGLIELGGAASTVAPHDQNVINGIEAQKQLAGLISQRDGLLVELKNQIVERKPIVEQTALIAVFSHVDPSKVKPQLFIVLLQICAESPLHTKEVAQCLTRFANHLRTKDLAYPLILNLLSGHIEYRYLTDELASVFRKVTCIVSYSDIDAQTIQHGALKGLWDLAEPSNEVKNIVKTLASVKTDRGKWIDTSVLIRGRAIELLGKWKLNTPEVIKIINRALSDSIDMADSLLYEYSKSALKELGIS